MAESWVSRKHRNYATILDQETRQRSAYLATREALVPFLVPHRFEGPAEKSPDTLRRSNYGFGVGLNKAYLGDIMGHLRGVATNWTWGPMMGEEGDLSTTSSKAPTGGLAKEVWDDCTRKGMTWRNFMLRRVLEWLLSSPGGFILVDSPERPVDKEGKAVKLDLEQAKEQALRPYLTWLPWGTVQDYGMGPTGLTYLKLKEAPQKPIPGQDAPTTQQDVYLLYILGPDGSTKVTRLNQEGDTIGTPVIIPKLLDPQGQPTLPFVPVSYGDSPLGEEFGTGLTGDLADIIIDMFNVYSEAREGFRDAAFGIMIYRGDSGDRVQTFLDGGSRFVDLGDHDYANLERVAGGTEEVDRGLALLDFALKAWTQAAAQKARAAQERAQAMSGIALQAEFQLDLAPLLREVAESLDQIETATMQLVGQMGGHSQSQLEQVKVLRDKEFRPEEEASRITRMAGEYRDSGLPSSQEVRARMALAWVKALDQMDLAQEVELGDGTTAILGDLIKGQLEVSAEQEAVEARNRAAFFGGAGAPAGPENTMPTEEQLPPI